MPRLREIDEHLRGYLRVASYPDDRNGILGDDDRQVARIGVALEPFALLDQWVTDADLDALLLHRAWGIERLNLPPEVGVLTYHLPFDDRLTLGDNPRLAALLELSSVEPFGHREARVIGMIGDLVERAATELEAELRAMFGGLESVHPPRDPTVRRIAVAGAMTEELVREASRREAQLYLTGQLRAPARAAIAETGIGVVAVGHARAEMWGLRCLAGLLQERWAGLRVALRDADAAQS